MSTSSTPNKQASGSQRKLTLAEQKEALEKEIRKRMEEVEALERAEAEEKARVEAEAAAAAAKAAEALAKQIAEAQGSGDESDEIQELGTDKRRKPKPKPKPKTRKGKAKQTEEVAEDEVTGEGPGGGTETLHVYKPACLECTKRQEVCEVVPDTHVCGPCRGRKVRCASSKGSEVAEPPRKKRKTEAKAAGPSEYQAVRESARRRGMSPSSSIVSGLSDRGLQAFTEAYDRRTDVMERIDADGPEWAVRLVDVFERVVDSLEGSSAGLTGLSEEEREVIMKMRQEKAEMKKIESGKGADEDEEMDEAEAEGAKE